MLMYYFVHSAFPTFISYYMTRSAAFLVLLQSHSDILLYARIFFLLIFTLSEPFSKLRSICIIA